jgi:uncharacterized protein
MTAINPYRRRLLQQLLTSGVALAAAPNIHAALLDGILFNPCETALPQHLAEHPIVVAAWSGIEPERYWDSHAHIAGTGDSGSGIYASPEMSSVLHPVQFTQYKFYLNAACTKEGDVDNSYVERLRHLVDELKPGSKLLLFAFEQAHDESGKAMPESTAFHVPNVYARDLAHKYLHHFEWVCSIHPYRPDAVTALETAIAEGARAVKWLPSAMGIDPASPKCDAFYRTLAKLDIPLICHAGEEKAVHGAGFMDANNPLKMRRALDAGVRVVVAHCASIGEDIDLDKGANGPRVQSFDLFTRLMAETHYQKHRSIEAVRTIIEHHDWHGRLLNGSDYPLPGVLPLISPRILAKAGLLDRAIVPVLDEIQHYNPLLFDFVLKRQLRSGTQQLPINIFHTRDFFSRDFSQGIAT